MPYAEGRLIHDADAHVFEPPGWIDDYLDPAIRERAAGIAPSPDDKVRAWVDKITAKQRDPEFRERDAEEIMLRKGFDAPGAFLRDDRPAALDLLGFASQLIFTTAYLGPLLRADRSGDPELSYGFARAHNRGMVEFCSVDRRLLPACYVPLSDLDGAAAFAQEAIDAGAAALLIASACPRAHSPSHVALDGVWSAAQEAGVPVVFHVGGGTVMDAAYKDNGLPPVKDFTGGDGNFTSVSFMTIPTAPMQTLAVLILDGVLDRFPDLKFGVIEQGAAWIPGWMRMLDSAAEAFAKNEDRLKKLSMKPSEFVIRQVRATPYPHEPAGWIVRESHPGITMFSSDYPHTEGGRNPLKRFEISLEGTSEAEKRAFYCDNFVDLMGRSLERAELAPAT